MYINIYIRPTLLCLYISPRPRFLLLRALARDFYCCGRLPAKPRKRWSAHRETVVPGKQKNKKLKMFRCQRAQSKGVRETGAWKKMDTS